MNQVLSSKPTNIPSEQYSTFSLGFPLQLLPLNDLKKQLLRVFLSLLVVQMECIS